jgi:hypothetical protein
VVEEEEEEVEVEEGEEKNLGSDGERGVEEGMRVMSL